MIVLTLVLFAAVFFVAGFAAGRIVEAIIREKEKC